MSYPNTQGLQNIDAEILAFQQFVSTKTAHSSRPLSTAGCLWARYLQTIVQPAKTRKRAPSNFAKFNDGLGESGVTLKEAITGIRRFIQGGAK